MNKKRIWNFVSDNYNISIIAIEPVEEGVNNSYFIIGEEAKFLLKLIPKAFGQTIRGSLDVLRFLEINNFPSPNIVLTKSNQMSLDYDSDLLGVLYHFKSGHDVDDIEYEEVGKLIGKLHVLMESYKGKLKLRDKDFFINRYIHILEQKSYDARKIDKFKEYGNQLWDKVMTLPKGFCHGDLHKGNIIVDSNNQYHILDFDTSCYAFPLYDIVILCNSTDYFKYNKEEFEKTRVNFGKFLKGYELYKTLSIVEKECFYYLIGVYHFQLQATIIEIHGLDCVNENFIDNQLDWLMKWKNQSENYLESNPFSKL